MRTGRLDTRRRHAALPRAAMAALGSGLALLLASGSSLEATHAGALEVTVFRAVNRLPDLLFAPVWAVMQLGSLAGVLLATAAVLVARRPGAAARVAATGAVAYVLPKVAKAVFARGRPAALLDDVVLRDPAEGLGFPSGHATVAFALAVAAWPWLGPRGRVAALALAATVAFGRVYVGVHLPLDVLGGAGLGLAVAGAVALADATIRRVGHPRGARPVTVR